MLLRKRCTTSKRREASGGESGAHGPFITAAACPIFLPLRGYALLTCMTMRHHAGEIS